MVSEEAQEIVAARQASRTYMERTKGQKKAARKARQKEDKKNKQLEMKKLKFGEDFIDPDVDPEYNEIYGPPKPLHTQ